MKFKIQHITKLVFVSLAFAFPALSTYAGGNATATFHLTNVIRGAIGMVTGYDSVASYQALVCGTTYNVTTDSCDGPPRLGIVGAAANIGNQLQTIAASAGIATCDALPASGTVTGTNSSGSSVTLTFQTPTHSIPAAWTGGGTTYAHRVSFTQTLAGDPAKFAYEFNCGSSNNGYIAVNMSMSNASGYSRLIALYTGEISSTRTGIEIYMSEYNSGTLKSRAADAMRIEYNSSSNSYNLWGVVSHNLDTANLQFLTRLAIAGNYSTGVASVFASGIALNSSSPGNYINTTSLPSYLGNETTLSDGNSGTPTASFNANIDTGSTLDGNQFFRVGCLNFTTPDTAATSGFCSGLTPTAPTSAPYLDTTTGAFSMNWVLNTMPTKIEVLP